MQNQRERSPVAGFTIVELLVVIVVIGLMATWGLPAMMQLLGRIKLTGAAEETIVFMQKARLEAIKQNATAQVSYQNAGVSPLGVPSFVVTVTGVADPVLGPSPLPKGVSLWGPTDAVAEGANAMVTWTDGPTFNTDGSAAQTGAFRLRDTRGNYLEVRLLFQGTGKSVVRKWFGGNDATTNWHERGEAGYDWEW